MSATPLLSDRSAYDVDNHPDKHASDLAAGMPVHHVPAGQATGDILQWDGTKWVLTTAGQADTPIMTLGTFEGDIEALASPFRIYNRYGSNRIITEVYLSVATAPTGSAIKVDVQVDGTSIFTGGSEAQIAISANVGSTTTFANNSWPAGSYLTWEIDQIGSSVPGANLVVHIVTQAAPAASGSGS